MLFRSSIATARIVDMLITNLYAPSGAGTSFYATKGYLAQQKGWKSFTGNFAAGGSSTPRTPGIDDHIANISFPTVTYTPGPATEPDMTRNPRRATSRTSSIVFARGVEDLHCDILEGHLSASVCHLTNISYRSGRKLVFDPATERFVNDKEADRYLTRPIAHLSRSPTKSRSIGPT